MEHRLTTYIRTKIVFKHRLNDLKNYSSVRLSRHELSKLGVCDNVLQSLIDHEIFLTKNGEYTVSVNGPIDPSLLKLTVKPDKVTIPLTDVHLYMRKNLMYVSLPNSVKKIPVYFQAFLDHRGGDLSPFFTVDSFSNRVHTPVVNLKGDLRKHLLFYNENVVSLDVKQMQPLILAKVLNDVIGNNPFTETIYKGDDVYMSLYNLNPTLKSRDEAKKMLFQLIFGHPQEKIKFYFSGDTKWIDWINTYKSTTEPKNPHSENTHTNLAWLLQYSEVQIMYSIWSILKIKDIPFLTIHDDILCRERDYKKVADIMDNELKKHFPKYEVKITRK